MRQTLLFIASLLAVISSKAQTNYGAGIIQDQQSRDVILLLAKPDERELLRKVFELQSFDQLTIEEKNQITSTLDRISNDLKSAKPSFSAKGE